jgi:hypothetical protein
MAQSVFIFPYPVYDFLNFVRGQKSIRFMIDCHCILSILAAATLVLRNFSHRIKGLDW